MKVIFLDIDGVLNVIPQGHDEYGGIFHPEFMENLKWIVEETGAKIVISSSWRKSGLKEMQALWKARKIAGEVIDTTPSLYLQKSGGIVFYNDRLAQHPTPRTQNYSIPRGCEIQYWLDNSETPIENYVIIDDDTDMLLHQLVHFVQCSGNFDSLGAIDGQYGLTWNRANSAIQILNSK